MSLEDKLKDDVSRGLVEKARLVTKDSAKRIWDKDLTDVLEREVAFTLEDIARKLEPLMPNEVRHWMKVRDLADPELKELIGKQIVSLAYQKLGDFRRRILLSLPPPEKAKGSLHLGTVLYEKEKWPFVIS